ncbi:asparaginase domain-containing protein [Vreelandella venusta]|uniref:asparaginase domain-containing protein n=1 Tax=Vreelandella venusta TaxID=44935 RepID=UPI0018DA8865|nr:asparaginase [Halomonas venusta]
MAVPVASQPSKPVVLTCAKRTATSSMPDRPQNLCNAAAVAHRHCCYGAGVIYLKQRQTGE